MGKWINFLDEMLSTTTTREVWATEDTETISRYLEQFKTCPTKTTIRELFHDSDELRDILERKGFSRCYEKVKNLMMKKKNKS